MVDIYQVSIKSCKERDGNMKKRILAIGVAIICLSVIGYGTLAFFTDEAVAHNVITTGGIEVEIRETTDQSDPATGEPLPFQDLTGVMPGKSVSKIVQAKNVGTSDAWIRVLVDIRITESDPEAPDSGSSLPLIIPGTDINAIQLDFNLGEGKNQWTLGEDGYYYYNSPIGVKEGTNYTEPLFENVKFAPQMDNTYQGCKVMIDVFVEAVQAANNPIPENGNVTDIVGWPNT